jgi:zinc/manganese transport system substrate-binding protein
MSDPDFRRRHCVADYPLEVNLVDNTLSYLAMKIPNVLPALLLTLCPAAAKADLTVASLSTVTTDLARQIGGDHVRVQPIITAGIDPHEFEPTPGDVRCVVTADLVLLTGKGIDGYLPKLEQAAGSGVKFLDLGAAIPSLTMIDAGKSVEDPHWWHSIDNMTVATRLVTQAFEHADPENAAYYRKNGKDYLTILEELQRWTRVKVAELPHSKRILVTSHDALQYFARDNGFSIDPVKGISTTEEPSSRHVRDIIELIRKERVKAVFFESIENPQALERITSETGAKPGGILYSDGLGQNEASTYDSMMRHNVSTIVDALKPDAG